MPVTSPRSASHPSASEKVRKARRITRACDYCHQRSIRCRSSAGDGSSCQNCVDFDQPCTFNRQVKRRGAKPRHRSQSLETTASPAAQIRSSGDRNLSVKQALPSSKEWLITQKPTHGAKDRGSGSWQAPFVASQAIIVDLVEIYFETVYPIFPLFHRPSYVRKISRGEYATDKHLFTVTMALCGLAAARVRDGAVYDQRRNLDEVRQTPSETFYEAAVSEIADLDPGNNLNALKTRAVLAITAIQYGKCREMQRHLGFYHAVCAMYNFHDEKKWSQNMGIIELEERRRLFWSMYTLDIFTSIIWSGVMRCRERQSNVSYPSEVDDEDFDDSGYRNSPSSPNIPGPSPGSTASTTNTSWLRGWNFTTDLYRVLEYVIAEFSDRRVQRRSFLSNIFGDRLAVSAASVRDRVMSMYASLPGYFKETPPVTCDIKKDRYGFQAANITATIQLLRMVLFAAGGASIDGRCQIAREVVEVFLCIPVAYLKATSSPLFHHLAGIGTILGSVLEDPLSENDYRHVRTVLLSLAQLLDNLEQGLHSTASAERLRMQVARIDEYMEAQRQPMPNGFHHNTCNLSVSDLHNGMISPSTLPSVHSASSGQMDQSDIFPQLQLPSELLNQWPWGLDVMQNLK